MLQQHQFLGEKEKITIALNEINAATRPTIDNIGRNIKTNGGGYSCNTYWEPNITGVKRIADKYGLDFSLYYEEPGNKIIGDVTYKAGELTITELDGEDYEQITFDDETKLYTFQGETNDDNTDFLLTILLEKVLRNL